MVEIIDRTNVLDNFFTVLEPELQKMKKGCLVVMEPIKIKLHKPGTR